MNDWRSFLRRLALDRKGATVIEYGFIIALVILAMMVALVSLGSTTTGLWNNVSTKVQNPSG
jgi:pilus assembly protein Flp/PilA